MTTRNSSIRVGASALLAAALVSACGGGDYDNTPAPPPTPVTTVSEAEMQRLGGYAGPAAAYRNGGPGPYVRPYPRVVVGAYPYPYYRGYYRGYYY